MRIAESFLIVGAEVTFAAQLGPGFELCGQLDVVDSEANDVQADLHTFSLHCLDHLARVTLAGFLTVGDQHDGGAATCALKVQLDGLVRPAADMPRPSAFARHKIPIASLPR
jgi:hypothetical protein